jgi:excinuclease ABC subunit C
MNQIDLATLPTSPGIYLFKDAQGTPLYIGKAKNIRIRVRSYFKKYTTDWKIESLIKEHSTVDYILTANEHEALLLEAQLVNEHKPRYNVLLKEGQPYLYILVTKDPTPLLELVRNKKKKGLYFGPFLQKMQARSAYRYLMHTFRLKLCTTRIANGCLDYHLELCAGSCRPDFDQEGYLFRLELATQALKKNHATFLKMLKARIVEFNKKMEFEKTRHLTDYLHNFDTIFSTLKMRFSPEKFASIVQEKLPKKTGVASVSTDIGMPLAQLLGLPTPISTIDCFDISHFQGASQVGSCVRFQGCVPDKKNFRHFIIKSISQQNDYAALQEIVTRRYKDQTAIPDLIMIDGGKGQRNAVKKVAPNIPCIALAKREETLFSDNYPEGIKIDNLTEIGRLLIALRDYAHHFAIKLHRKKQLKRQ